MIVPALEKRLQATRPLRAAVTLGSLALALLLGGAVIAAVGVNPLDAYAALSRGPEQLTVRASRRLAAEPETLQVGPLRYEVVEPLRSAGGRSGPATASRRRRSRRSRSSSAA